MQLVVYGYIRAILQNGRDKVMISIYNLDLLIIFHYESAIEKD